jgi:hypothetical protein
MADDEWVTECRGEERNNLRASCMRVRALTVGRHPARRHDGGHGGREAAGALRGALGCQGADAGGLALLVWGWMGGWVGGWVGGEKSCVEPPPAQRVEPSKSGECHVCPSQPASSLIGTSRSAASRASLAGSCIGSTVTRVAARRGAQGAPMPADELKALDGLAAYLAAGPAQPAPEKGVYRVLARVMSEFPVK